MHSFIPPFVLKNFLHTFIYFSFFHESVVVIVSYSLINSLILLFVISKKLIYGNRG